MTGATIPATMKPWHGGDSAPADWDGGPVLGDDGDWYEWDEDGGLDWRHGLSARGVGADIIAYTPLADQPSPPVVENSPYIAGPIWAEEEDDCFTAEVQIIGGHYVVATVHGATREEVEQRQAAILAALSSPASVREAAQFLSDRLDTLEWMDDDLRATCRDYFGHVEPAHARLKAALAQGGEVENG